MTTAEALPRWGTAPHHRLFVVGDPPPTAAPSWLADPLERFTATVADRAYPCHFGRQSLGVGDVFATWLGADDPAEDLAPPLAAFLDRAASEPGRRAVLACFVSAELVAETHERNEQLFWRLLHRLHAADARPWPEDVPLDPDAPHWEFCFHGQPMFVFAASPTHTRRASRNLGDCLVLLFQPRHVFRGIEGGTPPGDAARAIIRRRVADWDLAPPHPAMGTYGDAENREWLQYFIDDADHVELPDRCPFSPDGSWRGVPGWLEDQAQRTPESVALVDASGSCTYVELLDRVAALAARIRAADGVPGDVVGVVSRRTAESAVALLACLWAGVAYVPLDPAGPDEPRARLMDQLGVRLVLCASADLAVVPPGVDDVVLTDECRSTGPTPLLRPALGPTDTAYVVPTSGSSGPARAVAVSHAQLASTVFAQHALERPGPGTFLMPLSWCSDAAAAGLLWTLTSGGRVVLPGDGDADDPAALREWVRAHQVTHTDSTPALWSRVLRDDAVGLESLQCVQVGGEPCPLELAGRHARLLPGCVLENNYGPTEATVWSTALVLRGAPQTSSRARGADAWSSLPIGRALPGVRVALLDETLTEVPDGTVGELFVQGDGVAQGYVGLPAATAERFLPDPWSPSPGRRMYRTGDRAVRSGGDLHLVGRLDQQVKLGGHRVELGEVEQALFSHPAVDEACAVLVHADERDVLVGVVRTGGGGASPASLAAHLVQRLPRHAVPARYLQLPEFPRLGSGKPDRRRLASLARESASGGVAADAAPLADPRGARR